MPVHRGKDVLGPFYQYGQHGKKYRYISGSLLSRNQARRKALLQGIAMHAHH